ncbi:MAG: sigma factor G inhibitor Gin [Candidatus Saccharibacteria bacterium]
MYSYIKQEPQPCGQLLPRCWLCGEVPVRGIMGGYLIRSRFICEDCETDLVHLTVENERYNSFVEKLKELW